MQGLSPNLTVASDGFFLNLSWVLLHLSAPFTTSREGANPRLSTIDSGYCSLKSGDNKLVVDFSQETKLVSGRNGKNFRLHKTLPGIMLSNKKIRYSHLIFYFN